MAGPDPAVAAVRLAVRQALLETPPGAVTYAAVSGGADSLALLAALAWEAPRQDRTAACVTVDHGLHDGSAAQAAAVVARAGALGVPATVLAVAPDGTDEDAARRARYAAHDTLDAAQLHLCNTPEDQA